MPTYKIKINFEETIEADNEDEVLANFENSLTNESISDHVLDNMKIVEVCPDCETELKPKMIDTDGTNLEERLTCEQCGYNS